MPNDLTRIADTALVTTMPASLRAAIDAALAKGDSKQSVLAIVRRIAGRRSVVTLAVEAYLGADQCGRIRD